MGDAAKLRAQAVLVRSEAREAAFNLRTQWDIAHHLQTEVVPLRQFIHDGADPALQRHVDQRV